jgi:hypothetical protein
MPSSYQPNVPTGLVFLDQDYANIQQNFSSLDTYFGVDHTPYSTGTLTDPNGYHQSIHMVPVSTTTTNAPNNQPVNGYTAITGFGQLFTAQINDGLGGPDEALYYLSGGGKLSQLTRNVQSGLFVNNYVASGGGNAGMDYSAGVTYLPGGLLMQYGRYDPSSLPNGGTIKFPFKSAGIYNIQITPISSSSSSTPSNCSISYKNGSTTADQFEWKVNGSNSDYRGFFWMTIGI